MNFIDLLKRSFMDSWTGGASGEAGKYHAPGAFDNFKAADLFDNDRWIKRQMVDTLGNPKFNRGGDPVYTNYYNPREEDITDVTKIADGKETRTISRKYKRPSEHGVTWTKPFPLPYERKWNKGNTGYTPEWARQARVPMNDNPPIMGPWQKYPPLEPGLGHPLGNPFGYPERTAIKGPPRYTDVPQDMSGSTRMYPPQRHTSARTYPYEMNTVPPPVNTHVPGVVNGQAVDFPLAPQELPGMDLKMRTDILRELVRLFIRRSD